MVPKCSARPQNSFGSLRLSIFNFVSKKVAIQDLPRERIEVPFVGGPLRQVPAEKLDFAMVWRSAYLRASLVKIMEANSIKRLPVMRGERIVGILTRSDYFLQSPISRMLWDLRPTMIIFAAK
jgi:hypothetical protein